MQKKQVAILVALSCLLLGGAQPIFAAEDGSLDSMWMEHSDKQAPPATTASPAPTVTSGSPASAPAATTTTTTAGTTSGLTASEDTAAPMCTLDNFKNSAIVSKGGWPGVGPFTSDSNNDYVDENQNKMHVDLNGEQITRAQLDLPNRKLSGNADKDLLDMQMHIDFFLEAVGIKAGKIQDLNVELAKNKEILLKTDETPLSLKAGRCAVTIEKRKNADNKLDYTIAVSSLDANQQVLKQHSVSEVKPVVEQPLQPTTEQPTHIVMTPPPVKPAPTAKPVAPATPAAHPATEGQLKEQFVSLISSWQKIKKAAVRNKDAQELPNVLAGKALIRQADAVKWLTTNHKYYEMTPKGVTVDQYAELAPKKYMVSAQVHEAYKFIDEPTGKVLKDVDDINKVNYTIEKIGGKWVITDSALLSSPKGAVRTSGNDKTTR